MVSAGAAGPAGAQAERTGARGKNAAFFSSFCFFLRHGNLSLIPTKVPTLLRFLHLHPIWKRAAQRAQETFPNLLWVFEVRELAGAGGQLLPQAGGFSDAWIEERRRLLAASGPLTIVWKTRRELARCACGHSR